MSDQYVGEIRMFAGNFAPQGWALCNGQVLKITDYQMLFAVLGTTYGGDGRTTFGLPDLRGRVPIEMGTSPSTRTNFPLGRAGGSERVVLTSGQLPAHTHSVSVQEAVGGSQSPAGDVWASSATSVKQYAEPSPTGGMNAAAIAPQGGSQSHDNLMPFLCMNFVIALEGIFPTPN